MGTKESIESGTDPSGAKDEGRFAARAFDNLGTTQTVEPTSHRRRVDGVAKRLTESERTFLSTATNRSIQIPSVCGGASNSLILYFFIDHEP
jgi:hypothetical protein